MMSSITEEGELKIEKSAKLCCLKQSKAMKGRIKVNTSRSVHLAEIKALFFNTPAFIQL